MAILGKKYPDTLEEFYKSHLPGTFDPKSASKRMRLPTPETWETQVSLHVRRRASAAGVIAPENRTAACSAIHDFCIPEM